MRSKIFVPVVATALLGMGGVWFPQSSSVISQEVPASASPTNDGELELLQASAAEFVKAFNAGDAKAIGALFLEKAEVVDEDGNLVQGRENIQARFAELFQGFPKASVVVEITSLRQISPAVAIEEGVTSITLVPDEPASVNSYTLVHLKKDGKWQFASVRDFPPEVVATPHDHLTALEWMVGNWVDESPDGRVETACEWSKDGNYLLLDYVVKAKRGGELKGTQRLGWDPLRRSIRGWVFDESGGVIESEWTPAAGSWLVHGKGHTAEGQAVSFTRVFTPTSNDGYQIDTTHRIVGGELLPDSTVRVVRRPPAPAE
jgi:uncharacterized protein (TIGR02246 family)